MESWQRRFCRSFIKEESSPSSHLQNFIIVSNIGNFVFGLVEAYVYGFVRRQKQKFVITVVLLSLFRLTSLSIAGMMLLVAGGTLQGMIISLMILTLEVLCSVFYFHWRRGHAYNHSVLQCCDGGNMTESVSLHKDVERSVHAGLISPVQFIGKAEDHLTLIVEDTVIITG